MAKLAFGIAFALAACLVPAAAAESPQAVPIASLDAARDAGRTVTIAGTVVDRCDDDFDTQCSIILLQDGDNCLPVFYRRGVLPHAERYVGAHLRLRGVFHAVTDGVRRFSGPYVELTDFSDMTVVTPAPTPFSEPELGRVFDLSPLQLRRLGRRRTSGRVLAVWGLGNMLIGGTNRQFVTVSLAHDAALPSCGDWVTVAGYPETDLFRVILSRADWRPEPGPPQTLESPRDVTADRLLPRQDEGRRVVGCEHNGHVVRLKGILRSHASPDRPPYRFNLEADGLDIPVDLGRNPGADRGLPIGSEVEVTGVWIVESPAWSPWQSYPHVTGYAVVLRTPGDLRVLSRPPWWTPAKFLGVIVFLLAAVCAVLVWNRILQRIVTRRGRELFKEQVARLSADLRVGERTRLAVELHDALSQNLTGVACQLSATRSALAADPPAAVRHLDAAERMLLSSRNELRRCLWDLRGDTLEEPDFGKAVRKTIEPVLGGAEATVRFNVPRARLSDTTAHAVLCIVRELVANAVRHGGARHIRIAGGLDGAALAFSVRDDGCGFDAATAPGPGEGHFGLMGIRERLGRLNGRLAFTALPGGGVRAAVTVQGVSEQGR